MFIQIPAEHLWYVNSLAITSLGMSRKGDPACFLNFAARTEIIKFKSLDDARKWLAETIATISHEHLKLPEVLQRR